MQFLYTFGIRSYTLAIRIASLFNPKAKEWIVGRKNTWSTFPSVNDRDVIWFHCASLGEFDQGLPVMNLIKAENPNVFLLVTFFSPSGFLHYNKRKHSVDFACYLPADVPSNAARFVNHFKPKKAIFVKYEFWSNYIFQLKKSHASIYSISTLLNPKHRFFKWYGGFFRKTLKQFDHFFVQNEETKKLLESIDIQNVAITGDNRYDRVIENKENLKVDEKLRRFIGNAKNVFIVGSSWPVDEAIILPLINKSLFDKVIIAPHAIDENHVQEINKQIKISNVRYTNYSGESEAEVMILDAIGQLASCYSLGQVAYVGGGFTGSLHNILEPAVFGLPVIFGPKHSRFPEADAFLADGFGFEIETAQELENTILQIQSNQVELSKKAIAFVEKNQGASRKIVDHIFK